MLPLLLSIHLKLARLATQSSRLNCQSRLKQLGNNVCDVIIAHVISADVQIYIPTDTETRKVNLRPANHAQSARQAGKKMVKKGGMESRQVSGVTDQK